MKERIAALEEANLAEKSWQMGGEATAKSRPENRWAQIVKLDKSGIAPLYHTIVTTDAVTADFVTSFNITCTVVACFQFIGRGLVV